jgi:hypothetical protein
MSLSTAQQQTLQTDVQNVIAAAQADALAQQNLAQAQSALTTAQAVAAQTGPALSAAGYQLVSDAENDFPPATSPTSSTAASSAPASTVDVTTSGS